MNMNTVSKDTTKRKLSKGKNAREKSAKAVKCPNCNEILEGLQSLGQHRHKTHEKIVNQERIDRYLAIQKSNHAKKKACADIKNKSAQLKATLEKEIIWTAEARKRETEARKELRIKTEKLTKEVRNPQNRPWKERKSRKPAATDLSDMNEKDKKIALRKAWRTAFEKNRKTTVERIFAGKEPQGTSEVPDGSREFWENIFTDQTINLLQHAQRIKYAEDATLNKLTAKVERHEVEQALKKIKRTSAGGPDGITKDKISEAHIQDLTDLLNEIVSSSRVPKDFKKFKLHLIAKVENSKNPKDY